VSSSGQQPGSRSGVRVSVPASSANLGPGFDVLGLALDLLDVFDVWDFGSELRIEVDGEGTGSVPTNHSNLFFTTMQTYFTLAGYQPSGLVIREHNRIPLARGLGSSAATIVGALLAARAISGHAMDDDRLLDLAGSLEGHPDNIGVALLGGFQMVAQEEGGRYLARRLEFSDRLGAALFVPELLVSTESAREVLPEQYARADVVHNLSRLALLVSAIKDGRLEDLRVATEDRLHQPYRAELVPGFADILAAATSAGAAGVFLSGAGPTVLALHDRAVARLGLAIAEAMAGAAAKFGLEGRRLVLDIRQQGADVTQLPEDPARVGPPA
jgi:homoserine kinase